MADECPFCDDVCDMCVGPLDRTDRMADVVNFGGCYVQCWNCWAGLHSSCSEPTCRCMGAKLGDKRTEEIAERNSSRTGEDNRNPGARRKLPKKSSSSEN